MTRRTLVIFILISGVLAAAESGMAYALWGASWPSGAIVMQLQLGPVGGSLADASPSWGASAEAALANWNNYLSRVSFRVVRDSLAPVADHNGYNNVFWGDSVYGLAFGPFSLAITSTWRFGNTMTDADTVFNRAFGWNSYRGPLSRNGVIDFRRVALHEFGHSLGLLHPDDYGQRVNAIMNANISDLEVLTADDIAGVQALYGGSTPPPTANPPGAPTSLTVSAFGSSVSLAWHAPLSGGTPATYVIEAGTAQGLANLANFSTGSTATSYSATGVGNGVYYVRVRASNVGGTSAASNEALLFVGAGNAGCIAVPGPPGSLVGTAIGTTVILTWSAASGSPTSYVVEAGSGPGLANLANSDLGATLSYTAQNVARGTYYVRMRAKNACGEGASSNEVLVRVP